MAGKSSKANREVVVMEKRELSPDERIELYFSIVKENPRLSIKERIAVYKKTIDELTKEHPLTDEERRARYNAILSDVRERERDLTDEEQRARYNAILNLSRSKLSPEAFIARSDAIVNLFRSKLSPEVRRARLDAIVAGEYKTIRERCAGLSAEEKAAICRGQIRIVGGGNADFHVALVGDGNFYFVKDRADAVHYLGTDWIINQSNDCFDVWRVKIVDYRDSPDFTIDLRSRW
ncbi:MAG: hypothetical protein K6B46_03690 [Opitutales bacterium]|nr:hypothetical protein [Opitutales bacterium]